TPPTAPGAPAAQSCGGKRTYIQRTFDGYGNVVQVITWGDYDTSGDETLTQYTINANPTPYVVSAVADVKTFTGTTINGTQLSETVTYYDNNASSGTMPSKGWPTKIQRWLGPSTYVTETRVYEPSTGRLQTVTDENSNPTNYAYDGTTDYVSQTTNALN